MKKIGLLILVLVMAIGSLGVGYAMWSDTVSVEGTIETGMVVLCIEDNVPGEAKSYKEVQGCDWDPMKLIYPDMNWQGWIPVLGSISCPPGYGFDRKPCTNKDVAYVTFTPVYDDTPVHHIKELQVTIHNAYPYYLAWITFELCNCGNIPLHVGPEIFSQNPSLLIEYRNGAGQLEPRECHEISFYVGVTQWLNNDPAQGLTPQGADLEFTITLTGYQWNEWPLQ